MNTIGQSLKAVCPDTQQEVLLTDGGMWASDRLVQISCPACRRLHYWDQKNQRLSDERRAEPAFED
jgi:hypothetical protein